MSEIIMDGTGTKFKAKVDNSFRLLVDSVSRTQAERAILKGDGYNLNTGLISLTNDSESGVFHIEYTGQNRLVIEEVLVILGDSTSGSGVGTIKIIKNASTGTLISNGLTATQTNRNFSSSKTLTSNIYKGAEGYTVTNGDTFARTTRSDFSSPVSFSAEIIVIGRSNSLSVTYTPPSGNTSQNVIVACTCFEEKTEIF